MIHQCILTGSLKVVICLIIDIAFNDSEAAQLCSLSHQLQACVPKAQHERQDNILESSPMMLVSTH